MKIIKEPLYFFNKNNIPDIINIHDIYFSVNYGKACEYSDKAEWECCIYKDLIYVYLKRHYKFQNNIYYDLITPYGYSGYYYKNKTTYDSFILLFRNEAKKRNYITEVVRQNPYVNIELDKYDIITKRTIFGINLQKYKNFDEYLNDTSKDNKRGYNIATKNELFFEFDNLTKNTLIKFLEIYNVTMNNLNATDYYYFNNDYYNSLINLKNNICIANVKKNNIIIASCLIFKYNNFLHYHIGGSLLEYRNLRPNNFLHCNVIKYGIDNNYQLYILGGGLKDDDTLYNFKKKIGNINFNYVIYKNVLNNDIYERIKLVSPENDGFFPIHR